MTNDHELDVFRKLVKRGQIIEKSIQNEKTKIRRQNIRDSLFMVILFVLAAIAYIHVFWK